MRRGQSSTEFIVLISLVLVTTLIAVVVLIDVPEFGSETRSDLQERARQQSRVDIVDYIYAPEGTHLHIANNNAFPILVQAITVDSSNVSESYFPTLVHAGERKLFTLYSLGASASTYDDEVTVWYCFEHCLKNFSTPTREFSGVMSEAYLKDALDPREILSDYLLYHVKCNGDVHDHGPYGAKTYSAKNLTYINGLFGQACAVDNTELIVHEVDESIARASVFNKTYVTWARRAGESRGFYLFAHVSDHTSPYDAGYVLIYWPNLANEQIRYQGYTNYSATQNILGPELSEEAFSWAMFTFVFRTNQTIEFYVNDTLTYSVQFGDSFKQNMNSSYYSAGGSTETNYKSYHDESMYFNKTLSDAEISSLYQRGVRKLASQS